MFDGIAEALSVLSSSHGVLILLAGTVVGLFVSILPGISGVNAMAILLPLTFVMDQSTAIIFLVAIMAAGGFAGSITSILLNVPGEPVNAATTLDGYPLARQGKAGMAIAASATASAFGAVIGLLLLVLSIPILRELILYFGPPELFAFAVAGIALIGSATGGSMVKGLVSGCIGMVVGAIGYNSITGEVRYTAGSLELYDGIPLIAAVSGLFAIPELYHLIRRNESVAAKAGKVSGGIREGVGAVVRRPGLVARSSALGTLLGMIPGVGGAIASWMAYFAARRTSRNPDSFGKGNIEGVIAPDATLNAKEGGSMMPVLALGLPGSLSTAVLLSAFLLHGVTPGQTMFNQHMPIVWAIIITMAFVNIVTSLMGLGLAGQLVKVTLVPINILAPVVLVLVLLGSYVDRQNFFSIGVAMVFGLLGVLMIKLDYSRAALLLGMILFPIAEYNFHISRRISRGSYDFLLRPATLTIIVLVLLALILPLVWRRWVRPRRTDAVPSVSEFDEPKPSQRVDLLGGIGTLVLAGLFGIVSFQYSPDARLFPLLILGSLLVLSGWLIIGSLRRVHSPDAEPGEPVTDTEHAGAAQRDTTPALVSLAWILALPVLIWLIGTVTTIFVYTVAFMLLYRPKRPTPRAVLGSVLVAAALAALAGFGFEELLAIRLPEGALLPFLP